MFSKTVNFIRLYYLALFVVLYISFHNSSVYALFILNTFLAYIPIELTFLINKLKRPFGILFLTGLWLLFFPNNFYLFTDLLHLSLLSLYNSQTTMITTDISVWFKLLMVILSVLPTTFLGCWSVDSVSSMLNKSVLKKISLTAIIMVILFLNTIGVYLGRFGRLNSIDSITSFKETAQNIVSQLVHLDVNAIKLIILFYVFSLIIMATYLLITSLPTQKLVD